MLTVFIKMYNFNAHQKRFIALHSIFLFILQRNVEFMMNFLRYFRTIPIGRNNIVQLIRKRTKITVILTISIQIVSLASYAQKTFFLFYLFTLDALLLSISGWPIRFNPHETQRKPNKIEQLKCL